MSTQRLHYWVSLEDLWHLTSSGKYLASLPSNGEAMLDGGEGLEELEEAVIVLPAQPHRREPCDLYARGPISKAAGSPRDGIGLGGNAHLGTIGDWEGRRWLLRWEI